MDMKDLSIALREMIGELEKSSAAGLHLTTIKQEVERLEGTNIAAHMPALLSIIRCLVKLRKTNDDEILNSVDGVFFDVEYFVYAKFEQDNDQLSKRLTDLSKNVYMADKTVSESKKEAENAIQIIRDESQRTIKGDASELRSELDGIIKRKKDLVQSSDSVEKQLKERHDNIKRLLNDVSSEEISSNYFEESIKELKSSRVNKVLSIAWMLLISISISNVINKALNGGLDLSSSSVLYLTGLFALLSLPALFLSKEATKRRREHNELRRTALNMQVLGAYIYDLKDADRAEVKKKIAELIYSNNQPQAETDTGFLLSEILKNLKGK